MTTMSSRFGSTASEQMFFGGAPLVHVVLYYEIQRRRRLTRSLHRNTSQQHRPLMRCLEPRCDVASQVLSHIRAQSAALPA